MEMKISRNSMISMICTNWMNWKMTARSRAAKKPNSGHDELFPSARVRSNLQVKNLSFSNHCSAIALHCFYVNAFWRIVYGKECIRCIHSTIHCIQTKSISNQLSNHFTVTLTWREIFLNGNLKWMRRMIACLPQWTHWATGQMRD